MRRPAPLCVRPLPALVLAALLLPLALPAHAEDPLPRPSGVSPADLFTVEQSRPLEGFSIGVGGLTQLLHLPPGYPLDVLTEGGQPFRLRRLGDKAEAAQLTVTEEGVIKLQTRGSSRISV